MATRKGKGTPGNGRAYADHVIMVEGRRIWDWCPRGSGCQLCGARRAVGKLADIVEGGRAAMPADGSGSKPL